MHICRKWRRIVFAYQRPLHLRLFCTHGTPVLKILNCWPTMPIVVQYGGLGSPTLNPPAPEDEDNIVAALNQSDRIASISLTVTRSLMTKLSAIKRPFSNLEDLVLVSQDGAQLTLPSSFQWGSRLRCFHCARIAFPSLLKLLASSKNLVDLHLHEKFSPFPPSLEALTSVLSRMVQLQSLSLHFYFTVVHLPPSGDLAVLPALTRLNFLGRIDYLEGLVSRIDAPLLADINVTFLDISIFDLPELRKFTVRTGMHEMHNRAVILASELAVSISLTRPGDPTCLTFQLYLTSSSQQLYFIARICVQFSAILCNVEELLISVQHSRPEDKLDGRWLESLNSFIGVKWFCVAGTLSTDIVCTLLPSDTRRETVLPALHKLYILEPAPLTWALKSLITSRQLSGHPVAVEYERRRAGTVHDHCIIGSPLAKSLPLESLSQQVTVEMLSEDTLLSIFRQFLDVTPQYWPRLVWVCQKWRQIVLASPLGLNLRLHCTYGTPVLKTLDFWPPLPIIVRYGGVPNLDPPALNDDDNIIAALKQSDRVRSISLTITKSLLNKITSISEPLSELEDFSIQSFDIPQPTLPSTFRWGPLLRTLHSTRIAFPSFPRLLSPSQGLVDIQLHEIPSIGYFSPEEFANAMSGMTHLRNLSLHFLSLPPRRNFLRLPPLSGERIVLPSLTCLKYRGTSKYLDSFVARIDAPLLGEIDITFFFQPTMDTSQLGIFIERIEMQNSLSRAKVETSTHAISISFTNSDTSTPLRLRISCKELDWQLCCMAQICDRISPYLFHVGDLKINSARPLDGQGGVYGEQWLDLLRSFKFSGAKNVWVASDLTADILCVLGPANEGNTHMLPSLRHISVQKPMTMDGPSWEPLQSFISKRSIRGRPVEINAPSYQCHICHSSFKRQQELKRHLRDEYGYEILCLYCGEFECRPGRNGLFREHLESKHAEVVRDDKLISKASLTPSQLVGLFNRHGSLRAPDIDRPTTTAELPPHFPDPDA